ncbi:MAG: hypothetical protein KAR00_01225 [Candidatus Pacebacteria bacterium]|nr:hypothetical protein [Candidatus Paceibacterota bacterium]
MSSTDKKIEDLGLKITELTEALKMISERQNSQYTDIMLALKDIKDIQKEMSEESIPLSDDKLYDEAKELVIKYQIASVSFLQRILRIGYSRVAFVMDKLEENGVIGHANGSEPHAVLIKNEDED